MRDLFSEFAFCAVVCLVGGIAILVWINQPALAILGIFVAAIGVGWIGWGYRRNMDPGSSRPRRLVAAGHAAGGALLAAFILWFSVLQAREPEAAS